MKKMIFFLTLFLTTNLFAKGILGIIFLPPFMTEKEHKVEKIIKKDEKLFFPKQIIQQYLKKDIKLVKEPSGEFYKNHPNIKEAGFMVYYNCNDKKPDAVAYPVYGSLIDEKNLPRKNLSFRPDYQLPKKCRSYPNDYTNSGEDRGHKAPNANFDFDRKIQKQTFLMSNIAPQAKWLNRKYWAKVERYVRFLARKTGKVYVITGSCGNKGYLRHKVVIPKWWYKIIYIPSINKYRAFLAPNINEGMKTAKLKKYLSTIEEIKKICYDNVKHWYNN